MTDLPASLKGSRCIVHIDLDCFYCQVEMVRHNIPLDQPVAVRQWDLLIAVNYPARRKGIKKITPMSEAQKLCPEIKFVHVATYGPGDQEPQYYPSPSKSTHKVSLDLYREASKKIFKIFRKYCDTIQRIGLDEGFLDITDRVNQLIMDEHVPHLLERLDDDVCGIDIDWDDTEDLGITVGKEENTTTWKDLQLAVGARIAKSIRKEVFDELSYTCSAGIAHNKTVAKLGSNQNKPNNQTIVRACAVRDFMRDIPFTKIRNLGGKLGTEVEGDLGIHTAGDVWPFELKDLKKRFGESTGTWIYRVVRGEDDEEVIITKAPKSLMAAKSFSPPVQNAQEMQDWLGMMSAELHNRMMTNLEEFSLWPKTLTVHFRPSYAGSHRSKSVPMYTRADFRRPEKLLKKVEEAVASIDAIYPCIGLALQATGLVQDESGKHRDISQFFVQNGNPVSTTATATAATQARSPTQTSLADPLPTASNHKKGGILNFYGRAELADKRPSHLAASSSSASSSTTCTNSNKRKSDPLDSDDHTGTHWICDRCSKRIPIAAVDEHTDYHFAMDLQSEERPASSSASSSNSNAFKRHKTEEGQQDRSKNLFFR